MGWEMTLKRSFKVIIVLNKKNMEQTWKNIRFRKKYFDPTQKNNNTIDICF